MITPETFICDRTCGECCKRLIVKVGKRDIDRISKGGYSGFFEPDRHINGLVLRRNKGGCIFLSKKGKEYLCKIYNVRPKVCTKYPFVNSKVVETCKPLLIGQFKSSDVSKSLTNS